MARPRDEEEIIVPFHAHRAAMGTVKQVRSTLIASSLRSLRLRNRMGDYERYVDPAHKDAILTSVAGVWMPVDVVAAHYEACDRLGYTVEEQVAIGTEVADKLHGTLLGMMVRMVAGAGVSPWTALAQSERLRQRLFVGGGVAVYKIAEKEGRAEVVGLPLLSIPYFRNAMRGIFQGGCELFCRRAHVHEVPRTATPTSLTARISWA